MSNELSLTLWALAGAGLIALLIYAMSKIEFRGHTETHNGIRVRELAVRWLRGGSRKPAVEGQSQPRGLECVVYVTLKSCS
jgi:hypothetical protein